MTVTEDGTVPNDNSSDYFSHYSDTTSLRRHRRSLSITVSTNGDFFSCIDEEEEREREEEEDGESERGRGGEGCDKFPSYLRSLGHEVQQIGNELEEVKKKEREEAKATVWTR